MDTTVRDSIWMFLAVVATAALLTMALPMVQMARAAENERMDRVAMLASLAESREWSRYEGLQTGADMIGFITRHKDTCDIVIRNLIWDTRLIPYLADGALTLGLADNLNLPDSVWDTAFLFDVVLSGNGECRYIAALLYDGQLTSGEGSAVTGIEYREISI